MVKHNKVLTECFEVGGTCSKVGIHEAVICCAGLAERTTWSGCGTSPMMGTMRLQLWLRGRVKDPQ